MDSKKTIYDSSYEKLSSNIKEEQIYPYKKFQKLKLFNKINIFNFLSITEKKEFFFFNKKLLKYLLSQFSRKSILIFNDILKKNPYINGIKLKKVFQIYYENKNYCIKDIFSAIFLYIKHLNEIYSEIILDFPFFDNDDYFLTSNSPIKLFIKDNISFYEKEFDKRFEICHELKNYKYNDINEILADVIDPKKTILNITNNNSVDKYLGKKIYRINILYFSKRGNSWTHYFNFSNQHLVFPKVECIYENLFIGDNVLDFNKNSYFKMFKNKVKNLTFEIYAEYNIAHFNNNNNINSFNDEDDNFDKLNRFFELENFIKCNSMSIKKINVLINNGLITFFNSISKNLLEMLKNEKFETLKKLKFSQYYSNNRDIKDIYIMFVKKDITENTLDHLCYKIEDFLFKKNSDENLIINGDQIILNLFSSLIYIDDNKFEKRIYRENPKKLKIIFEKNNLNFVINLLTNIKIENLKKICLTVTNQEDLINNNLFSCLLKLKKNNQRLSHFKIISKSVLEFKTKENLDLKAEIKYLGFKSGEKEYFLKNIIEKLKLIDDRLEDNLIKLSLCGKLNIFGKKENKENELNLKNIETIVIKNLCTFEFFKSLSFLKTENLKSIIFEEPRRKYFEEIHSYLDYDEINDKYIDYLKHLKKFSFIIIDSKYDDIGVSVHSSHLFLDSIAAELKLN